MSMLISNYIEVAEKTYLMVAAEYSPFYAIEKGAVLQEARCFNDPHIDSRRCQQVQIHPLTSAFSRSAVSFYSEVCCTGST